MGNNHVANIEIDEKALLYLLGFDGGHIRLIWQDQNKYNSGEFIFQIEHTDLPEVVPGATLERITPAYQVDEVMVNGRKYSRITRLSPLPHPERYVWNYYSNQR